MGSHGKSRSPLFRSSVEKLLDNWTALKAAVLNGQGGGYGNDIAVWMRGAVEDFFYQNDDLMSDEVAEFIGEIMNQELDTIIEDNSLEELGERLCHHFRLAMDPAKEGELRKLHSDLDAESAKQGNLPKVEDESDESSSEEEEMMETEDAAQSSQNQNQLHKAGQNIVSEPDEEGWVTVCKSRKN